MQRLDEDAFMEDREIVATLNDLLELNYDSINGLETAADAVDNETYAEMFRNYADTHRHFNQELTELIVRHSGEPTPGPTATGALRNVWLELKAAVTDSDGAIITTCDRSEEAALEAYRQAMGKLELSSEEVRDTVRQQMSHLRLIHEKVHDLGAVLKE